MSLFITYLKPESYRVIYSSKSFYIKKVWTTFILRRLFKTLVIVCVYFGTPRQKYNFTAYAIQTQINAWRKKELEKGLPMRHL